MPINVQMPDGTIISDVPDNASQADVLAKYQSFLQNKPPAPITPSPTIAAFKTQHANELQGQQAGLFDLASDIGTAIKETPRQLAATGIAAYQGNNPEAIVDKTSFANRIVQNAQQKAAEHVNAPEGKDTYVDFMGVKIARSDVQNFPQNFANSIVSMGSGLLAGVAAGAAVAPETLGLAAIPVGYGAIMAGAGAAAYRIDTNNFLRNFRDGLDEASLKQRGIPLSNAEFLAIAKSPEMKAEAKKYGVEWGGSGSIQKLAQEHGTYEAGIEAAGSALGIGAGKFIFRKALEGKVIKPVLAVAGEQAAELAGESATQIGQTNVERKAGLNKEEERSFLSPADWQKSFSEVAGPTLLQSIVMGGVPYVAGKVLSKKEQQNQEPTNIRTAHVATPEGPTTPPVTPPVPNAPVPMGGMVSEEELEGQQPSIKPPVPPVLPHTLEEIMEKGEPVETKQEAEKAHSDGDTVYGFHEQDEEHPVLIKDIDQLKGYTPDQLMVVPKEEKPVEIKKEEKFVVPKGFSYVLLESPAYEGLNPLSLEDADFELEALEENAKRGRMTPQRFAQSEIGKRLDTGQITQINEGLRNDPVGTIQELRKNISLETETIKEKPTEIKEEKTEQFIDTTPIDNAKDRKSYINGIVQIASSLPDGTKIYEPDTDVTWTIHKRTTKNGTDIIEFSGGSSQNVFQLEKKKGATEWKETGDVRSIFDNASIVAEEKPAEVKKEEEQKEEVKTQAQINQERQQAKKEAAGKSEEEKLVDAIKDMAYKKDTWTAGDKTADDFIAKYGRPMFDRAVEAGLLDNEPGSGRVFPSNKYAYDVSPKYYDAEGKKLTTPKETEAPKQAVSENKIFTEDAATKARNRLRQKLNQLNSGVDPEFLIDGITLSGYHVEKGARTFAAYAKAMIDDLGDKVIPYLKQWYTALRMEPTAQDLAKEMDSHETVMAHSFEKTNNVFDPDAKFKLAESISKHLLEGNSFKTIIEARKFISDITGEKIEPGTAQAKEADETIEVGVVLAAQKIAHETKSKEEAYDRLVDLYNRQPNLSVRSSTSVKEQAYSTPAPLAYVASKLAGINEDTTVYEPTAGNGMLLIDANPKNVKANELNASRYEMLKRVLPDADITNRNALGNNPQLSDVVIANPPFGAIGEEVTVYGIKTREIDHAIAYAALDRMPVNGRAVLIVGGVRAEGDNARKKAYRQKAKREFYFNLYKDYNVVDHFTVAGDMYSKQGASYPVDVIVINGKGQAQRSLPAAELPQIIKNYAELKEKLNEPSVVSRGNDGTNRANIGEPTSRAGEPERLGERPSRPSGEPSAEGKQPTGVSGQGVSENEPSERTTETTGTGVGARQPGVTNEPERVNNKNAVPSTTEGKQPRGREGVEGNEPRELGGPSIVTGERTESGLKDRRGEEAETENQVKYEPFSNSPAVGTLMPKAMAQAIRNSLQKVVDMVGNIDEYVANELQMDTETLFEKFSAEQIDALALAIKNAQEGKGFIIGDQTGIGKGRVVAAMIRYALLNDQIPIFITKSNTLYPAMINDLDDIGMTEELGLDTENPKILFTNNSLKIPYTLIRKVNGKPVETNFTIKTGSQNPLLKKMIEKDSIAPYKVIFSAYTQIVGEAENERKRFMSHFASDNYLILDESHEAGGTAVKAKKNEEEAKGKAAFIRQLVDRSNGSFYSSATYAKSPDVMDLYSSTNMKLAVGNISELAAAIKNGGIPMQQIVANMLTQDGQYIRRERTFKGVSYNTVETKVNKETAEKMATSLRDILAFSRAVSDVTDQMQEALDLQGGRIKEKRVTITFTTFGSKMHSLIAQMLLSLKAEDTVRIALEAIKAGEKPVITVSNTMGSFLQEYANEMDIKTGDPINLSFKDMFLGYLEKQRTVKITKPHPHGGPEIKTDYRLTDNDLGPIVVEQYNRIKNFISNAGFGSAPMSPIDYIKNGIEKANSNYKVDEITGRTIAINYSSGVPTLITRNPDLKQKTNAINGFNNGQITALIINQSGSTGISLHAAEKFKDKSRRHMIIAQADLNIDVHMQTLGRVLRTGQVITPIYSQLMADIPAEMRPAAVLLKKMASLNANTTASRKSAVTAEGTVDFMNDYGGQVAQEFINDNPDVYKAFGGQLFTMQIRENPAQGIEEDIRKLTGYIPILPLKQQEEIYKDLIERYNDLLERENSMGTNKLEAKALDLDAETISSTPITEGKGDSLFAQPAYMEQIDVKRTVKPYSKKEVEELVEKNLKGKTATEFSKELAADLKERTLTYSKEMLSKLKESGTDEVKIQNEVDQLNVRYNKITTILSSYKVGTPISVKNMLDQIFYGVVINIENKKRTKDPTMGSDWKMTIAMANGESKSYNINFRQVGGTSTLRQETDNVSWYNPETQKGEYIPLLDMFDKGATQKREKRWIVTGNILAGYAAVENQGQIISYKKNDGTTGQGILMSRDYDFEKAQRDAPIKIKNADDAIQFMKEANGTIGTPDKTLQINKNGRRIQFNTPSSKKVGGTYFLDPKLTKLLGDFYKSGSVMYAYTYDEDVAKKAIDYLLNDKGETLIALNQREQARKMFEPKVEPLENIVPRKKTIKDKFDEIRRKEIIASQRELTKKEKKLKRQIINGENTIDTQREITFVEEARKENEENLALISPKTLPSAWNIFKKAGDEYQAGNISEDVYKVFEWMYKNAPSLLTGLKLQVRQPVRKETTALGMFDPMNRLIRLYKGSDGIDNPSTARHELTHTLEQMMTPQVRLAIINQWAKDTKDAIRKNTDPMTQAYFEAINDYMANPTSETYKKVRMHIPPNEDLYQYANPSEYWAVNAERLMAMKMGTPWHRFVMGIRKLIEGLKHLFGFNSKYILYKTFDDIMKGNGTRLDNLSLRHLLENSGPDLKILENPKIQKVQKYMDKHDFPDTPSHKRDTVKDTVISGYVNGKNNAARLISNPGSAVQQAVNGVDRLALGFRVNAFDFTAGLKAVDAQRYGRLLIDGEGRAIASVAMDQALKASHIGLQVLQLGKLNFNFNDQMFEAVEDKHSVANIISLAHELEKEIGIDTATNLINKYFEAKRSKSIIQEHADRMAALEDLKTEQMNPDTTPDRQLQLLNRIPQAEEDLNHIKIALQKVNMSEEAIEEGIAFEKDFPQLREMMDNWNSVSKNLVDNMEQSRMISKETAKLYRKIKDYVPWQRIQPEDISQDPSKPTYFYGKKGVRNVSKEHKFKPGETELAIANVLDNMINHTMVVTRNCIRNYAANRIAQVYGERDENGKLKVYPAEDFSKGIVSILVNGRKVNIRILNPLIAQAVIGMESFMLPLEGIMSFGAQTLRRTITWSGVFQLRQLFMDIPSTIIVTGIRNPISFYVSTFGSFIKSLNSNDPIVKILRSHGIGNIYSSSRTAEQYATQQIGLLNEDKMSKLINMLEKIGDASDLAPRRAIYAKVMKETRGDRRKALLAASNVINWDQRGASRTAQALTRSISFLNAFGQQVDVLTQALAEPVAMGVEKVTGAKITSVAGNLRGISRAEASARLFTGVGIMMAMSLLYTMAIGDDDEYKKLDDQTKMRNFFVPRSLMRHIGVDHSLLIPITTTAGYICKALPEMLYNRFITMGTKDEVDATRLSTALKKGALDAFLGPLASGPVPTIFKPFVEIGLNHDFFTGGKVTPDSMKNLSPFLQYNANTSELGRWISASTQIPYTGKEDKEGNTIEGSRKRLINPMEADHIARGLYGSVAGLAMWTSDLLSNDKPTRELRNNPLFGSFISPEVPRGREDIFYDLKNRAEIAHGTFVNEMQDKKTEQARKWMEANKGLLQAYGFTQSANAQLNEITKNIHRIERSNKSPDEKQKEINFFKNKKENLLKDTIQYRIKAGL